MYYFFSTETALFLSFAKFNISVFVLVIIDIDIQKMLFFDFSILIFINILYKKFWIYMYLINELTFIPIMSRLEYR